MEIDKQLADSARAFFDNYTAQSLKIPQINDNLLNLRSELDRATQAINGLTEQSKVASGQIRDNVALLGTSIKESTDKLGASMKEATAKLESVIDKATEQAKEGSQSAAKLARSLNIITFCLVGVGIIQILVSLWHR